MVMCDFEWFGVTPWLRKPPNAKMVLKMSHFPMAALLCFRPLELPRTIFLFILSICSKPSPDFWNFPGPMATREKDIWTKIHANLVEAETSIQSDLHLRNASQNDTSFPKQENAKTNLPLGCQRDRHMATESLESLHPACWWARYFTSTIPGGSKIPPRASTSAYISSRCRETHWVDYLGAHPTCCAG